LRKFKVGLKPANGKWYITYHFFNEQGVLTNCKYRNRTDKKDMFVEKDCESIYYGIPLIDLNAPTVHVVEGEDDAHALYQLGIRNVLSVPYGAKNYSPAMDELNRKFKTIILLFDNDPAGQEGAYSFAQKAGLNKCKNVVLPFKDARDCLINGLDIFDIGRLIGEAKEFKHTEIVKADDLRLEVMESIVNDRMLGTPIEITEVNRMLGGVRLGELTIVTGHTGSGKSTFALNFAAWCVNAGLHAMIMPFENKLSSVIKKLIEIFSKDAIYRYDLTQNKNVRVKDNVWVEEQLDLLNNKNLYFLNKTHVDKGYYDLKRMESVIEYAVKFYNMNLFVVDHLHYFLKISDSKNPVLVIDEAMRTIKQLTEKYKVHIVLVVHPSKKEDDAQGKPVKLGLNSSKGASSIAQESDNFLVVSRPMGTDGKKDLRSKVEICKNRECGHTGEILFNVLDNLNSYVADTESNNSLWQDTF
jgi:twinkle protein